LTESGSEAWHFFRGEVDLVSKSTELSVENEDATLAARKHSATLRTHGTEMRRCNRDGSSLIFGPTLLLESVLA